MADRCLLYYITDRSQFRGDECARRRDLLAKVAEAARACVDYIQLREKDLSTRELEMLAREAVAIVRENSSLTRLLINSRTDVALAAGADGVHLRADDLSPREARAVVRVSDQIPVQRPLATDHFLVATSCHSNADVIRADSEGADFVVFAPVFEKNNAPGRRPTGLAALHEACRAKIPVLALGGVTMENAAWCLEAGAAGVAGIRLFQENKIEDVVRALRAL
ncbi:MAG: thiamine phosphate synthase [Terriglobales bacterium]|jgi:thiamine-phosphate pyrophosphorylase